eukprot:1473276-Lingulodinium_polyedra.AAC.1
MGGWWSIENPLKSLLWRMPEVRAVGQRAHRFRFDACQHGACIAGEGPFLKPPVLLTSAGWLRALARRCPGEHQHVHLEGQAY